MRQCPCCGYESNSEFFFRRHALRHRYLLVIADGMIYRIQIFLPRWKCPSCNCTFTDYPPFVIPYKHYTLWQMREHAHRYVLSNQVNYRQEVTASGTPLFYADGQVATAEASEWEKENEAVPAMAHSTLYRWITTLGSSNNLSQEALEHMGGSKLPPRQQPQTQDASAITPQKYRSQARKMVLEACRNL